MARSVRPRRLFALRSKLAQRLTFGAAAGLGLLCVLTLASATLTLHALGSSWAAINAGIPISAGMWSLLAVLAGLASGGLAGILLSAPPRAEGIRLPRRAAEDLFALLDNTAVRLGIEPVRQVFVTDHMNAHVAQRPRWGCVGPLQTCLMIGLPLAHSLSPAQFGAVLAHELAHLSAQRLGWGGVGAHLRAWWMRTVDRAADRFPWLEVPLERMTQRYCIAMLRLARIEEFEADALAASLVGRGLMGDALVEVGLKARFLERDFWPQVDAHGARRRRPRLRPYRDLALGVEAGFTRTVSEHAVALEEADGERFALHPSLHQRLSALGLRCRVPEGEAVSAADRYLAPLLPSLAWVFDCAWWHAASENRRQRRSRARYEMVRED